MNLKALSTLAMGTVLLVGCQEEDYGFNGKDISYQKEFNEQFPNVDPAHNWCTVQARELQVKTSQSSDICVYDESGTQLLAHYYNINGADRIVFDLEVNAHRVLVSDGSTVLKVGLDEVADFSVTRAAGPEDNLANVIDQNAGPCPYYFFFEDLGAKADFDFNDIVLKVQYTPSNQPGEVKVSLMAAGGTLPFMVSYEPTGDLDAERIDGLFDKMRDFGVGYSNPVNVNAPKDGVSKMPVQKTIEVPAYYSVARHLASYVVYVFDKDVKFDHQISATPHSTLPEDNTPRVVVFRKHGADWSNEEDVTWTSTWPDEGVNIKTVYPAFETWVANQINAGWPNYMFEGDSDAVVYDTPYFYVKANTLTLAAAKWKVQNGNRTKIADAESTTVQIIPKRGYLDNQTVTAFLAGVETTDQTAHTALATLSDPSSEEPYTYTITANEGGLKGDFYLNVMLSGTDYTRPLSAALKFSVTYEGDVIINDEGDIEPGIEYTLMLALTNSTEEGTNVKTDKNYPTNQKYLVFYFDKYDFKLDGIAPEDYKNYEVEIRVDGTNSKFKAYSYTLDTTTKIWTINGEITPSSDTFTIPMDDFYNNIIKTGLNKLLVVRDVNGERPIGTTFYYLMIREKAN